MKPLPLIAGLLAAATALWAGVGSGGHLIQGFQGAQLPWPEMRGPRADRVLEREHGPSEPGGRAAQSLAGRSARPERNVPPGLGAQTPAEEHDVLDRLARGLASDDAIERHTAILALASRAGQGSRLLLARAARDPATSLEDRQLIRDAIAATRANRGGGPPGAGRVLPPTSAPLPSMGAAPRR